MKKMKRLVAVLLAGIMALAMFTACGGPTSAPVERDAALEKSVAEWTVELGKDVNLELTEDAELTAISAKCLPVMVKVWDTWIAQDQKSYIAAQTELLNTLEAAANGKKVAPVDVLVLNSGELTKDTLSEAVKNSMSHIQNILNTFGVEKPAKFGVTVTKQKDYTLVLFMVSE